MVQQYPLRWASTKADAADTGHSTQGHIHIEFRGHSWGWDTLNSI